MSKMKMLLFVVAILVLTVAVSSITSPRSEDGGTTTDAGPGSGTEPEGTTEGGGETAQGPEIDREALIPADAVKVTPDTDPYPPVLHSYMWREPVPMPYPINTAGGEDSPFVTPCGCTLYFFFTPDPSVPAEKQILDGVTGIYYSTRTEDGWGEAKRLDLSEGRLALDGCPFVAGDEVWFCSARVGNYRTIDAWIATVSDGEVTDVRNAGERLNVEIGIGEFHVTSDGSEIYFHSDMPGGKGGRDIWVTRKVEGEWQDPENVEAVNSEGSDSLPFVTQDGGELWFTRWYMGYPAIYVSKRVDGEWSAPELIISQFAAEPTLDKEGNIYFAHHFIQDGVMLDADIYVAYRRKPVEPADAPAHPERGFLMGVLPIPAEGQSFEDAYGEAAETTEIVPTWGRPTPFHQLAEGLSGEWGEAFVEGYTRGNGMIPLVHVSFMGPGLTLATPPGMEDATLSDPDWRRAYVSAVLDVVEASRPLYLSVGNEVNRWYEKYGMGGENGFDNYVSLYEEVYDAVKELSPETRVFCTFAREMVSENREADLGVLSLFDPEKMDLLVFTSYPHSVQGINAPEDIPDDYYSRALKHMPGKPLGFSELGWPSIEAFGGEHGQADFIEQVAGRLTIDQGADLHLMSWCWLHDLSDADHTGLMARDDTQKLGYQAWANLSNPQ